MITREIVLNKLNQYLNYQLTLPELVDWAENALVEPSIPDSENVELLMDIVMYLGAADSRGFPLTWEVLSDFLTQLGGRAKVVVEVA